MELKRVLICENDKETIEGIICSFNMVFPNCELLITDSSNQCIELTKKKNPDIFILGLDVIDVCGTDLIKQIRSISENPVIILSNLGNDFELIKVMQEGADRYFKKPIDNFEFITRIKALIRRESIENPTIK
jgi:two-component system, OmpR family, response regulator VicR